MSITTKKIWNKWELLAIEYLKRNNFDIIDINFKFSNFWEIDIICKKEDLTIFIEVKYRTSNKYWTWEDALTKTKLKKLEKTIYCYCLKNNIDFSFIRFDAIIIDKLEKSYKLKHYKNLALR